MHIDHLSGMSATRAGEEHAEYLAEQQCTDFRTTENGEPNNQWQSSSGEQRRRVLVRLQFPIRRRIRIRTCDRPKTDCLG
jgi:hypothetical protein